MFGWLSVNTHCTVLTTCLPLLLATECLLPSFSLKDCPASLPEYLPTLVMTTPKMDAVHSSQTSCNS